MKICIVCANYYPKISKDLMIGATTILKKNGVKIYNKIFAPGVFEIPIIISRNINKYDGFIALGCVVKGQTPHFDYISKAVIYEIMRLSTKFKKPIGNGIITCINIKQAIVRSNPNKKNKGGESAKAVLSILKTT